MKTRKHNWLCYRFCSLVLYNFMLINIKNRELGNLDSWNDGRIKMAADVKSGIQNT